MPLNKKIMAGIARKAGLTENEVKNMSPEKLKQHLTKRTGKKFKITSVFPAIDRGNVLRDSLVGSAEINKEIDKILGV